MADFEENWKNSKIIAAVVDAGTFESTKESAELPTNETVIEPKPMISPQEDFSGYIRAMAALETYNIVEELKKCAKDAVNTKNYKAALLIESVIDDLENVIED